MRLLKCTVWSLHHFWFSLCRLLNWNCYAIGTSYVSTELWYKNLITGWLQVCLHSCQIASLVARLYLMCGYGTRWESQMGTNFLRFYTRRICWKWVTVWVPAKKPGQYWTRSEVGNGDCTRWVSTWEFDIVVSMSYNIHCTYFFIVHCKGLHYLHHEAPESIIHGDLKSSNGRCILETIVNISYNYKPWWKQVFHEMLSAYTSAVLWSDSSSCADSWVDCKGT